MGVSVAPAARQAVRTVAVATAAIAVVCQFFQRTDPRFPLLYFTVDSSLLLGAVLVTGLVRPLSAGLEQVRCAALVGVLVSAVGFATVIAPSTATGTWFQPWDDAWVRTSTVLMHAVLPVLGLADDLLTDPAPVTERWAWALRTLLWPVVYVALVGGPALVGGVGLPYDFLQPGKVGSPVVGLATVVIVGLVVAAAWLVLGLRQAADRIRHLPRQARG